MSGPAATLVFILAFLQILTSHTGWTAPTQDSLDDLDGVSRTDVLSLRKTLDALDSQLNEYRIPQTVLDQRNTIQILQRLIEAMKTGSSDEELLTQRKRSCRLRLGGHCLTEALDRAATQYWYLKSPHSPGRRRRDTGAAHTGATNLRGQ